ERAELAAAVTAVRQEYHVDVRSGPHVLGERAPAADGLIVHVGSEDQDALRPRLPDQCRGVEDLRGAQQSVGLKVRTCGFRELLEQQPGDAFHAAAAVSPAPPSCSRRDSRLPPWIIIRYQSSALIRSHRRLP